MYIITAKRMISGDVLKYRNGKRWVMVERYATALPRLKDFALTAPFSAWDKIFPDQAVTVAAIDRLVHHVTILEMNGDSYRRRAAVERQAPRLDAGATTSSDNLKAKAKAKATDNIMEDTTA